MRKILAIFFTATCLSTAHAQAPCLNSCQLCGNFELGVHALAFTPMICGYDFASVSVTGGDIPTATVACQLDWGFRIFGRYLSDCSFAHLSYQWYESNVTNSAGAPFNTFRGGFVAERGRAELHLEYQNVDVQVGTYLHRATDCRFFFFGNVRWVDLHYRRTVSPQNQMGIVQRLNEKSDFSGIALGVGAGTELDLPCSFGIFGEANLLGVFGQRSSTDVLTTNAETRTPVKYKSEDCISPEMAWRFGLSYTCGWDCVELKGEIGYELDYFWNAIAFPEEQPENRFRHCENIGFSGLFFGLRFTF